jgi:H+/Cl- antiporter ClcA
MTNNMLYLLGVLQLVLIGGVTLFCPSMKAQVYVYDAQLVNGTLSSAGQEHSIWIMFFVPVFLLSISVSFFVSMTSNLIEGGQISDCNEYSVEGMQESGIWDVLFWCVYLFSVPYMPAVNSLCVLSGL